MSPATKKSVRLLEVFDANDQSCREAGCGETQEGPWLPGDRRRGSSSVDMSTIIARGQKRSGFFPVGALIAAAW